MTPRNPEAIRAECGLTHAEIRDEATSTHKRCSHCGEFKALDEFDKQPRGFKGRMAWCSECWKEYRAEHARRPEARQRRNAYLRSENGYRVMRIARMTALFGQRGAEIESARLDGAPCEACGSTERVCVDHDHELNEARGLLCNRCNRLLGQADEDPELLRRLADYMERDR